MNSLEANIDVLRHIIRYCDRISEILIEFSPDYSVFESRKTFQDAIGMNIIQIGELTKHLSEDYQQSTSNQIPWRSIRNMRNVYAHDYGGIRIPKAWEAITEDVPQLKAFCEAEVSAYDLMHPTVQYDEPPGADEPSYDDDDEWGNR